MQRPANLKRRLNNPCKGFSLVEAMIAVIVLTAGVLSLARMIPFATRTDYNARTDSTATFIAMRTLEQIMAQPWDTTTFTGAADGAGATSTINFSCTCATAPCTGNAGAPFVGTTETINYTAAIVNGYQRYYTINQAAAGALKINQGQYDVRWHVTCNLYGVGNAGLRKITVAARPRGNLPGFVALPVHVQAVKMK